MMSPFLFGVAARYDSQRAAWVQQSTKPIGARDYPTYRSRGGNIAG
jgi:hypothetical protein